MPRTFKNEFSTTASVLDPRNPLPLFDRLSINVSSQLYEKHLREAGIRGSTICMMVREQILMTLSSENLVEGGFQFNFRVTFLVEARLRRRVAPDQKRRSQSGR